MPQNMREALLARGPVSAQLAEIAPLSGASAPTTSTVGAVGQLYLDTTPTTGRAYICTAKSGSVYTWTPQALKSVVDQILTEKTGYGVVSGLYVSAQSTPDMTVKVSAGVYYKSDGTRYAPAAVASVAITPADVTNPRIDIIYLSSAGAITYLAGTPAASPSAPTPPAGAQLLAEISVAANQTTIQTANITVRKKGLWMEDWISATLLAGVSGYVRYAKDVTGKVTGRVLLTPSSDISVDTVLATFPTGYRSIEQVPFIVRNTTTRALVPLYVVAGGSIMAGATLTAGQQHYGLFIFPTWL